MAAISACIICKNQAHCIARALDSLAWCENIAVVDSGSTDGTLEVIRSHALFAGGKIQLSSEPWRGFSQQRQHAASLCPTDWVLLLDADEECSPELAREIQGLREDVLAKAGLFRMPRKNYVAKRYVRCWSPDYQARFIHKERTHWGAQSMPEIRTARAPFTMDRLKSPLLHNRLTPATPEDFCDGGRMEDYANRLADAMQARHKKASLLQLLTRPVLTFFKYYILKGSFLDGRFGLAIAYKTTIGTALKYSVLYGRELQERESSQRTAAPLPPLALDPPFPPSKT